MYKVDWDMGELQAVLKLIRLEIDKADLRLDNDNEDFWRGIRQKLDNAEYLDEDGVSD